MSRRRLHALALFAAAAAHSAAAQAPPTPVACPAASMVVGVAVAVRDGATLVLADGRELRLAGIDPDARAGAASPATSARRSALNRLAMGQEILVGSIATDRYGRIVAQAHARPPEAVAYAPRSSSHEPVWLQAELVSAGLALVFGTADSRACLAELLAFERAAEVSKAGRWGDPAPVAQQAGDPSLSAATDLYQLVEGRVVSVGASRGTLYLNFGHDWSSDFTAVIFGSDARRFMEAGFDPQTLTGRRVRLRGFLILRDGPSMRIDHPEQIEILDGNDSGGRTP